jgi:hypothetical protein
MQPLALANPLLARRSLGSRDRRPPDLLQEGDEKATQVLSVGRECVVQPTAHDVRQALAAD